MCHNDLADIMTGGTRSEDELTEATEAHRDKPAWGMPVRLASAATRNVLTAAPALQKEGSSWYGEE